MEIRGKIALVTGSAKRVGKAIALALAGRGAHIVVHYNTSTVQAEEVAAQIRLLGVEAVPIQADLADPVQVDALFEAVTDHFGRLDVLVNSASVYDPTPIESLSAEQWDRQFDTNARGPALCIRHAFPLMREHGGAIVNLCDISAARPYASYLAYCASKAALLAVTVAAAKGLAQYRIRVNSVSPGIAMWQEGASEATKASILRQVPLGRPGSGEEVAQAALFLIAHDYITGEDIHVDGGWHLR